MTSIATENHPWSESMCFHPWVGHEYFVQHQRWLILGESHYGDAAAVGRDFTQQVTRDYVTGEVRHPFWTKVANLFLEDGADTHAQRDFWHRVAFYNYVQEIVGAKARIRPGSHAWQQAESPFREVLRVLRPTHMLVLGKTLWENMPYKDADRGQCLAIPCGPKEHETWRYETVAGESLAATWVYHPSTSYFERKTGKEIVSLLANLTTPAA